MAQARPKRTTNRRTVPPQTLAAQIEALQLLVAQMEAETPSEITAVTLVEDTTWDLTIFPEVEGDDSSVVVGIETTGGTLSTVPATRPYPQTLRFDAILPGPILLAWVENTGALRNESGAPISPRPFMVS